MWTWVKYHTKCIKRCLASQQEHRPLLTAFKADYRCLFLCLQRTVPAGQNSLALQPLLSDTEYKVSITPVYAEGDGAVTSQMGRTRKSETLHCPLLLKAFFFFLLLNECANTMWTSVPPASAASLFFTLFFFLELSCRVLSQSDPFLSSCHSWCVISVKSFLKTTVASPHLAANNRQMVLETSCECNMWKLTWKTLKTKSRN